ncbi:hypothetical protein AMBR_FBHANALA_00646 [Dolosigranulum pigrum]|uniref:DUF1934 domain-containing protein n=1 Tax=Dolosigranulum pigrum TaxID=29394 RepID=UPI000DC50831|nr:DUF1934 domain-containing protein [Dolosigranulum pigrum]QJS97757.1 DUF1934 domain-containing protein [Dolosigranulum pigrum]VTU65485.1 hypothetical protein AMBR_FBHANALA_00646 [Dolosigranulum pigrum]
MCQMIDGQAQVAEVNMSVKSKQAGQVNEHQFEDRGRFAQMKGHYYIKFDEVLDEQVTPVTVKINQSGEEVTLIRHAEQTTRLVFSSTQPTSVNYRTPAGIIQLVVQTNHLMTTLKQQPTAGEVQVDYQLLSGEEKLGDYELRLHFTT